MTRVLVAGVGNIFKGDDGFGVEVVQRLARRDLPAGVRVVDFGIRGVDLTYALLDGCEAAVLVDTAQRGGAPGDLYVIEPEFDDQAPAPEDLMISGHDLDPAKVLRVVRAMGGACRRILLVACEPLTFGGEDGAMGLSPPVAAAVATAQGLVEDVVRQLLQVEAVP
jgi:hydrogenase maturation protease